MYTQSTKLTETDNEQWLRVGLYLMLHCYTQTQPALQESSHSVCTMAEIHFAIKQMALQQQLFLPYCREQSLSLHYGRNSFCHAADGRNSFCHNADSLSLHYDRNSFCHTTDGKVTHPALRQKMYVAILQIAVTQSALWHKFILH